MDGDVIETGVMSRLFTVIRGPASGCNATQGTAKTHTQTSQGFRLVSKPSPDPFRPFHPHPLSPKVRSHAVSPVIWPVISRYPSYADKKWFFGCQVVERVGEGIDFVIGDSPRRKGIQPLNQACIPVCGQHFHVADIQL